MRLTLYLLGITSLLISCKQENNELKGHWVSTEYFEGKDFWTIDFEKEVHENAYSGKDTSIWIVNFNKNSLSSSGGYRMGLWDAENEVYEFCTAHDCDVCKLFFRNDTLFIRGEEYKSFDGDFVKIDEQKSFYNEMFNYTAIIGRLPAFKTSDSILNFNRTFTSNLNIGRGKFDSIDSDSIRINVWDVYIHLNEISKFVSRQKDALPETDRQKLKVLINADSLVKKEFLNQIIAQVNKADSTLKIHQSTFDYKANKVYYRRLK